MVDNPERLSTICLTKFASILKDDQRIWKNEIEKRIEEYYRQQRSALTTTSHERLKRKHVRSDDDDEEEEDDKEEYRPEQRTTAATSDSNRFQNPIEFVNNSLFLVYFLRGHCRLNSVLSERLATYLIKQHQFNDFTLSLFSSSVTSLKRLVLNVKYLSRLQCHILSQHEYLDEFELIFKDSNNTRTNDLFYHYLCPSIESKFDEIYNVYGSFILQDLQLRSQNNRQDIYASNRYLFQRSSTFSEGFSHQKLFQLIFNCLNPSIYQRLKHLKLSHFKFFAAYPMTTTRKNSHVDMSPLTKCSSHSPSPSSSRFIPPNFRLILNFERLTSLNLSQTDIKNHCLDLVIDSFHHLDTLDISSCRSLTTFHSLLKHRFQWKCLILYNCTFHLQRSPTIYEILQQCENLEYLDISNENPNNIPIPPTEFDLNRLLSDRNCLNRLKKLDISGQRTLQIETLEHFLQFHPQLEFLGLFLTYERNPTFIFDRTDPNYSTIRRYTFDLQDVTTNQITEEHVKLYGPCLIEALKRYYDRAVYVQKILYYVFSLTRSFASENPILLLELILHTMSIHTNLATVQMASTACIYNLTRTPLTEQINVRCLAKLVQAIIRVMEMFPAQQQLQKNCLLTLCSDRILHEPTFDFYRLASLVMVNLQNSTDLAIIQPGVAILALLTTRLTVDECTQLGSMINLQPLLHLIEQQIDRLQTLQINQNLPQQQQQQQEHEPAAQEDLLFDPQSQLTGDDTLRFCLSLLWNLTDENPIVCERFIHSMGLHLFQRLLTLFATDSIVITKIVGLLSNIAEVPHLRTFLYSIDIIPLMRRFLTNATLDIAFSAAGILSHLLYDQAEHVVNEDLCQQMRETIIKWQNPETNIITYRSFKPFIPLLNCYQVSVVQLWALWAIYHVCSTDRARYYRMIREEKLYDLMKKLYDDQFSFKHCDPLVVHMLQIILHLLKPSRSTLNHPHSSAVAS